MANDTPGSDDENVTRQVRAARRTARRHQQRKERLVQTTRALLEDEGPAALTASKIAKACDLTASALYYYFENLETLLAAVHADLFREELEMAEAALSSAMGDASAEQPSGFATLAAVFRAKIRFGTDNPKRWRALYQGAAGIPSTSTGLSDELVPLTHRFFARMEAALLADQQAGTLDANVQPRVLANLAFCQAQGILTMVLAAEAAGTNTLFASDVLVDTALATFRRGWWREV